MSLCIHAIRNVKVTILVAGSAMGTPRTSRTDLSDMKESTPFFKNLAESQGEELVMLRKTISGLREELSDSRHSTELVSKDLARANSDRSRAEKATDAVKEELTVANERLEAYDSDMRNLRIDLAQAQQELGRVTPALAVAESKILGFQEKIDVLCSELSQSRVEDAEKGALLGTAQAAKAQLEGELSIASQTAVEFESKYVDARDKIATLEYQLKCAVEEVGIVKEEVLKSEAQLKRQGNELDELVGVVEGLEEELREARERSVPKTEATNSHVLEDKVEELSRMLEECVLKLNASISGSELLQEEVSRLITANALIEEALRTREKSLKERNTEVLAMREEYEVAQSLLEEAEASQAEKEKELAAVKRLLDELSAKNEELGRSLMMLESAASKFNEDTKRTAAGQHVMELELQKTNGEVEKTRMELALAQAETRKIQALYDKAIERCEKMKDILEGVREELAATQARSDRFEKDVFYLQDKLKEIERARTKGLEESEGKSADVDSLVHSLRASLKRLEKELADNTKHYSEQYEFFKQEKVQSTNFVIVCISFNSFIPSFYFMLD